MYPLETWAKIGALLFTVLLLVVAVEWFLPPFVLELAANAGSGASGTFAVKECETLWDSDGPLETSCTGTFAGAGIANDATSLVHAAREYRPGTKLAVRYVDGTAYEQGVGAFLKTLLGGIMFTAALVAVLIGLVALPRSTSRRARATLM